LFEGQAWSEHPGTGRERVEYPGKRKYPFNVEESSALEAAALQNSGRVPILF